MSNALAIQYFVAVIFFHKKNLINQPVQHWIMCSIFNQILHSISNWWYLRVISLTIEMLSWCNNSSHHLTYDFTLMITKKKRWSVASFLRRVRVNSDSFKSLSYALAAAQLESPYLCQRLTIPADRAVSLLESNSVGQGSLRASWPYLAFWQQQPEDLQTVTYAVVSRLCPNFHTEAGQRGQSRLSSARELPTQRLTEP